MHLCFFYGDIDSNMKKDAVLVSRGLSPKEVLERYVDAIGLDHDTAKAYGTEVSNCIFKSSSHQA